MQNEIVKTLGKNIKSLRENRGFSKKELAGRIGIGVKSLSKLEEGIFPPRLAVGVLFSLEREFGIRAYRFLRDDLAE